MKQYRELRHMRIQTQDTSFIISKWSRNSDPIIILEGIRIISDMSFSTDIFQRTEHFKIMLNDEEIVSRDQTVIWESKYITPQMAQSIVDIANNKFLIYPFQSILDITFYGDDDE